eukprot:351783-Chlamydomonas_euryale.AAC.2
MEDTGKAFGQATWKETGAPPAPPSAVQFGQTPRLTGSLMGRLFQVTKTLLVGAWAHGTFKLKLQIQTQLGGAMSCKSSPPLPRGAHDVRTSHHRLWRARCVTLALTIVCAICYRRVNSLQ